MERMKFMMMMDWEKIRDNRGFYYYEGYMAIKKLLTYFQMIIIIKSGE